jgi:hypothetical protein
MKIKISKTIAEEWMSRGISDVIPELLEYPVSGGTIDVGLNVAKQIQADCEFNGDSRNGPEEMPGGTRRAYQALAAQIKWKVPV